MGSLSLSYEAVIGVYGGFANRKWQYLLRAADRYAYIWLWKLSDRTKCLALYNTTVPIPLVQPMFTL